MLLSQSFSNGVYASPAYREGYAAGVKAAHLLRPNSNPYPFQDLRHLGWTDAYYDAWSARRVEVNRASELRDISLAVSSTAPLAPSSGQEEKRDR